MKVTEKNTASPAMRGVVHSYRLLLLVSAQVFVQKNILYPLWSHEHLPYYNKQYAGNASYNCKKSYISSDVASYTKPQFCLGPIATYGFSAGAVHDCTFRAFRELNQCDGGAAITLWVTVDRSMCRTVPITVKGFAARPIHDRT